MVDPIGHKPSAAIDRRLAPVANVAPAQAAQPAAQAVVTRADPSTLKALAQPLATAPPVDVDRVSKIKKAIADGKFPLVPSTVADRLLALKLEWKPHEQT
jgi:negative regulator of flagellin synthesis FlgM